MAKTLLSPMQLSSTTGLWALALNCQRNRSPPVSPLADRFDTLVGIFGIGQSPTGSKDPFALRRASIAVLRMIIEQGLPLDLVACLDRAQEAYPNDLLDATSKTVVLDYLLDRLPALYEDSGIPVETFRAVRATGCTQPTDFAARLNAVAEFAQTDAGAALAAANKRVGNILAKAELGSDLEVSTSLLQESPEKELYGRHCQSQGRQCPRS